MFFGSTDLMSGAHTSRIIGPFLRWLDPGISAQTVAQMHVLVRKAAHVTEYAILTGLFFRALRGLIADFRWRAMTAFLPALIFSVADEYHQTFVPSRTGSPIDVLIDCTGALTGILVCRLIHLAWRRKAG